MQFTLMPNVPYPLGLERETADMAKAFRVKYELFFRWIQQGEAEQVTEASLPEPMNVVACPAKVEDSPWLLENWDIEYFYGLSRPENVSCACPFGWVEKVKRIVDQQYPIFGVERFSELFAKGAHIAWLLLKHEVFPNYNGGIAALAVLVLLGRNGYFLEPSDEDLKIFIVRARKFMRVLQEQDDEEETAIWQLAELVRSWQK